MLYPLTVLELSESASDEEVKRAYLRLIREHPPEREPEKFQAIREAYDACKTEKARLSYALFHRDKPDFAQFLGASMRPQETQRPDGPLLVKALAESLAFTVSEDTSDA